MSTTIRIRYDKAVGSINDIELWLTTNAGQGSSRFGGRVGTIHHWLNGDDWLWYGEYPEQDVVVEDTDYVFVFKDERKATEFALRFA